MQKTKDINNNKQFKSSDGYIYTYDPVRAYPQSYIKQAIIVLEQKIGRKLELDELPHHVNHVRDDDRPGNLKALSKSEHSRLPVSYTHLTLPTTPYV